MHSLVPSMALLMAVALFSRPSSCVAACARLVFLSPTIVRGRGVSLFVRGRLSVRVRVRVRVHRVLTLRPVPPGLFF